MTLRPQGRSGRGGGPASGLCPRCAPSRSGGPVRSRALRMTRARLGWRRGRKPPEPETVGPIRTGGTGGSTGPSRASSRGPCPSVKRYLFISIHRWVGPAPRATRYGRWTGHCEICRVRPPGRTMTAVVLAIGALSAGLRRPAARFVLPIRTPARPGPSRRDRLRRRRFRTGSRAASGPGLRPRGPHRRAG